MERVADGVRGLGGSAGGSGTARWSGRFRLRGSGAAGISTRLWRGRRLERGFPEGLAREYVTRHIVYELSDRHRAGLELFRRKVRELE